MSFVMRPSITRTRTDGTAVNVEPRIEIAGSSGISALPLAANARHDASPARLHAQAALALSQCVSAGSRAPFRFVLCEIRLPRAKLFVDHRQSSG